MRPTLICNEDLSKRDEETAIRLAEFKSLSSNVFNSEDKDYYEEADKKANTTEWTAATRAEAVTLRKKLVQHFIESETVYLKILQAMVVDMLADLIKKKSKGLRTVSAGELSALLRNIQEIYEDIHAPMYQTLKEIPESEMTGMALATEFSPFIEKFHIYAVYMSGQEQAMQLLENVRTDRQHFKNTLEITEQAAGCGATDAFSKPCERLEVYVKTLAGILETIDPSEEMEVYGAYRRTLMEMQAIFFEVKANAYMKRARTRVMGIQKQLWFPNPEGTLKLVTPTRYHIQDGVMLKKFGKTHVGSSYQNYWFFLFNDMLLYTSLPDKKGRIQPKYALTLMGAAVSGNSGKPRVFSVKSPVKSITIKAESEESRDYWVAAIGRTIDQLNNVGKSSIFGSAKGKRGW